MTLNSKVLPQEQFNSQCADINSIAQQKELTLVEQHSQIQTEIHRLQETLKQLEVHIVFDPPNKSLSVEERLEIHFQSIKMVKWRAKLLEKTQRSLAEKHQELAQIEAQLHQRQAEANQAMKHLKGLGKGVKQAQRNYTQMVEEFQTAAQMTQQILVDAYGQQAGHLFERRLKADFQTLPQQYHSLFPGSNR